MTTQNKYLALLLALILCIPFAAGAQSKFSAPIEFTNEAARTGTLDNLGAGSVGKEIFALDGAEQISLSRLQGWSETGSLVALDIASPNESWSLSLAATATEAYVRVQSETGEGYADLRHNGLSFWDTVNVGTLNLLRPAVVTGTVLVELPSASGTLALTSGTVNLTGNQTVAGNKTFTGTTALSAQPGQNGTAGSVTSTDALTVGGGDARYGAIAKMPLLYRTSAQISVTGTSFVTGVASATLPAGFYNVRARAYFQVSGGNGGGQSRINFTGTNDTGDYGNGTVWTAATASNRGRLASSAGDLAAGTTLTGTNTAWVAVEYDLVVQVLTAGAFEFQFAQNAADGTLLVRSKATLTITPF